MVDIRENLLTARESNTKKLTEMRIRLHGLWEKTNTENFLNFYETTKFLKIYEECPAFAVTP